MSLIYVDVVGSVKSGEYRFAILRVFLFPNFFRYPVKAREKRLIANVQQIENVIIGFLAQLQL